MKSSSGRKCHYKVENFKDLKYKVLNWANQFSIFCFLDNHQFQIKPHVAECLVAAGCEVSFTGDEENGLAEFQHFVNEQDGWLFGHFNYDLKNKIEELSSNHPDPIGFPDIFFFKPTVLIRLNEQLLEIEAENPDKVYKEILAVNDISVDNKTIYVLQSRVARSEYIETIKKLKAHILRGDCYEINYCIEFFTDNATINSLDIYKKLSTISPNPFSAFYRVNDKYLLCASPERFVRKNGKKILSQPIKGTSKRIAHDDELDEANKQQLINSEKDRSENVMVVDLVRNDLSKVCDEGTVSVTELFGIYSFPQVHQMISTIEGEIKKDVQFTDIIKACFPMGSMTGAPKKRVMELIEKYEKSRRGIFSGAVGYISPNKDFDFNVVIRSIMYNEQRQYLSYQAGSAITYKSVPEDEWEECLLKAEAIKKVLSG